MKYIITLFLLVFFASNGAYGAATDMRIYRDHNSENTFLRSFPGSVMARILIGGTAETITVPTSARFVIFSGDCDLYVKSGGTAAVPSADVTDGSASEYMPAGYALYNASGAVSSFSVVSSTACTLTASFYK